MTGKTDRGHWTGLKFDPDDYFGFVYIITNTISGRTYIGQKQLHRILKRPPLKGRKNKRHSKVESEWRKYTGSSRQLNEDINNIGKSNFTFEIVELHESRWELSYGENKRIYKTDALLKESYYNKYIGRVGRCPDKLIG